MPGSHLRQQEAHTFIVGLDELIARGLSAKPSRLYWSSSPLGRESSARLPPRPRGQRCLCHAVIFIEHHLPHAPHRLQQNSR
jgi:hypothetical protein